MVRHLADEVRRSLAWGRSPYETTLILQSLAEGYGVSSQALYNLAVSILYLEPGLK
jgi:hypothetical protein